MTTCGPLKDGFSTTVGFALNPTIQLWTKTVKPPGLTGGGAISTSTMENTRVRTKAPKALVEITDGEMKAAYNPAVLADIISMMQELQLITVTFADNSTWDFWGWLEEFQPDEVEEGSQPTASVKFICSGESDVCVETLPAYGSGS
jgi:hypothetical protein